MSHVYQEKELKPYDAGTPLQGEGTPNLQSVDDWIRYMMTVRERFGSTAMVGKFHIQWGASALWAMDGLRKSGDKMAHELRTMLSLYPDRQGGLYEKALHEWEATNGEEPTVFKRKVKSGKKR